MKLNEPITQIHKDVVAIENIPVVANMFEVICRTTGMGFVAIARVTEDKWVACAVRDDIFFGLKPGDELKIETTICNEIRQHHNPVVIDHVAKDADFASHHTPAMYGFQSYISIPIMKKDGSFFGTLCAIDPRPAKLKNPETIGMFKLFAELISFHLGAIEDLASSKAEHKAEQKTAEIREQFIAILGHDLRNPVGAIQMSADILLQQSLAPETKDIAYIIKSSSNRMSALIEDMLDFARGRMGSGIVLNKKISFDMKNILNEVVTELKAVYPRQTINTQFDMNAAVYCDEGRIAQLLSNLLGNALTHGDKKSPVSVKASSTPEKFILAVTNYGRPIPEETLKMLFAPFKRGDKSSGGGLGLGLYIASEIAKAHQGSLTATSSFSEGTIFTLEIAMNNATFQA